MGIWDFVVLEYMVHGSLGNLLRRKRAEQAEFARRHGRADLGLGRFDNPFGEVRNAWPWPERLRAVRDVAEGIAQMHAKRYIHRDLKPDNVLIDARGRCKVADLGLARFDNPFDKVLEANALAAVHGDSYGAAGGGPDGSPDTSPDHFSAAGGTPAYMAPDVVTDWLKFKDLAGLLDGAGAVQAAEAVPVATPSTPESSLDGVNLPPQLERQHDSEVAQRQRRTLWVTALPVGGGSGGGSGDGRVPAYMAHVTVTEKKRAWHGADAYALACIMHEIFTLRPLWAHLGILEIWQAVVSGGRPEISAAEMEAAPKEIAEGYVALMRDLWAHRPVDRPTMEVAMQRLDSLG